METIVNISLVIRTIIYLWAGIESLFLYTLYKYGYKKFKPTPIICMLSMFFLFLGISFLLASFVTFASTPPVFVLKDFIFRNIAAIFAFLTGYYLSRFRAESLKEAPKDSPFT